MQKIGKVISKDEAFDPENSPFSWKEDFLALQQELEVTKQRNEELTVQLIEIQNNQEETYTQVDMQQTYLMNVIEELEQSKNEANEKNKLLHTTITELQEKQQEVEMQQTYLMSVINDLESSREEIIEKNKILENTVIELESKRAEVEMQQTYLMSVIEELEVSKKEISEKNDLLEQTSNILNRAYTNIKDSINYAKRIQDALLPKKNQLDDWFQDYFIIFKPTDVVSGDFYWFTQVKNKVIVVAADCTGHGIPGAFMSILAIQSLHYIINIQEIDDSDQIVNMLHENTRILLRQHETNNMDGMDIALVIIDLKHMILEFTGAHNPLILIQNGNLNHIKGDRHAVGGYQKEEVREFTKNIVHVKKGDCFYIYSDGFQDMCGGKDSRRFMSHRFRRVLHEISNKDMQTQKKILSKIQRFWLRNEPKHLDDILVIGIRI